MRKYEILYKNGNKVIINAYNVEHHDGRYYIAGKAYIGDGPEWLTLDDKQIVKIQEV